MKTVVGVAALFAISVFALAHEGEVRGEILTVYPDQADTGLFALVEDTAPGTVPNGAFYYVLAVHGGDCFTLEGVNPFPGLPTEPQFSTKPEFDLKFTDGAYGNGPGDEAGTVPGDGDAFIFLIHGLPKSEFILRWC